MGATDIMSSERKQEITEVLKKGRYSLDSLPQLKAYLQEQIDQRTYDFEANLALLKIFQFNPSHIDIDVVQKVLIKALMNLPHGDFPLSLYVLPEAAHQNEGVAALKKVSNLLETAQFTGFWTLFEEDSATSGLLKNFPGFREAIQSFAVSVLTVAYQRVPVDVLASAVHLNGAALDEFVAKQEGWKTEDDQARQIKTTEQLDRKKVANIFSVLTK